MCVSYYFYSSHQLSVLGRYFLNERSTNKTTNRYLKTVTSKFDHDNER